MEGKEEGRHLRRAPIGCTRGNAAVEFALVAPVLLLFLLGTLVYGLYFGVTHSVQQLASEAVRASIPGITAAERGELAQTFVSRAVGTYGLLQRDALTLSTGFEPADPDLFTVVLRYDASGLGLGRFGSLFPMPPERFERRATIRRGGA